MIIWSKRSSLRVSQNQNFNLWDLYPNTQSKATSQVFTPSRLCCLERMSIVPAELSCTLTTCNHIQSNMQDRLIQLVQIYQYQAHNIKFSLIISNELVGVDITLNYSSHFGYTVMGFDTSTVTQDCDDTDSYFGIMTHCSIPVLQYGNTFM
jgi:hypothetical protein